MDYPSRPTDLGKRGVYNGAPTGFGVGSFYPGVTNLSLPEEAWTSAISTTNASIHFNYACVPLVPGKGTRGLVSDPQVDNLALYQNFGFCIQTEDLKADDELRSKLSNAAPHRIPQYGIKRQKIGPMKTYTSVERRPAQMEEPSIILNAAAVNFVIASKMKAVARGEFDDFFKKIVRMIRPIGVCVNHPRDLNYGKGDLDVRAFCLRGPADIHDVFGGTIGKKNYDKLIVNMKERNHPANPYFQVVKGLPLFYVLTAEATTEEEQGRMTFKLGNGIEETIEGFRHPVKYTIRPWIPIDGTMRSPRLDEITLKYRDMGREFHLPGYYWRIGIVHEPSKKYDVGRPGYTPYDIGVSDMESAERCPLMSIFVDVIGIEAKSLDGISVSATRTGAPGTAGGSATPAMPGMASEPATPARPGTAGEPATPAMPGMAGEPATPARPTKPTAVPSDKTKSTNGSAGVKRSNPGTTSGSAGSPPFTGPRSGFEFTRTGLNRNSGVRGIFERFVSNDNTLQMKWNNLADDKKIASIDDFLSYMKDYLKEMDAIDHLRPNGGNQNVLESLSYKKAINANIEDMFQLDVPENMFKFMTTNSGTTETYKKIQTICETIECLEKEILSVKDTVFKFDKISSATKKTDYMMLIIEKTYNGQFAHLQDSKEIDTNLGNLWKTTELLSIYKKYLRMYALELLVSSRAKTVYSLAKMTFATNNIRSPIFVSDAADVNIPMMENLIANAEKAREGDEVAHAINIIYKLYRSLAEKAFLPISFSTDIIPVGSFKITDTDLESYTSKISEMFRGTKDLDRKNELDGEIGKMSDFVFSNSKSNSVLRRVSSIFFKSIENLNAIDYGTDTSANRSPNGKVSMYNFVPVHSEQTFLNFGGVQKTLIKGLDIYSKLSTAYYSDLLHLYTVSLIWKNDIYDKDGETIRQPCLWLGIVNACSHNRSTVNLDSHINLSKLHNLNKSIALFGSLYNSLLEIYKRIYEKAIHDQKDIPIFASPGITNAESVYTEYIRCHECISAIGTKYYEIGSVLSFLLLGMVDALKVMMIGMAMDILKSLNQKLPDNNKITFDDKDVPLNGAMSIVIETVRNKFRSIHDAIEKSDKKDADGYKVFVWVTKLYIELIKRTKMQPGEDIIRENGDHIKELKSLKPDPQPSESLIVDEYELLVELAEKYPSEWFE